MLKITNYKNKIIFLSVIWILLLIAVSIWSVFTGQYPLTIKGLLDGDKMMLMVFFRLRLPRVLMGIIGGFGLSIAGYVYQLIFKNPLASPDIAGVSSGASAGAAFAIVAVSASAPFISICAFAGGLIALSITLLTAYAVPGKNRYTIILTGIAIHSVAQTILMFLKLAADPEKQLASIEYWIMGSLNGISIDSIAIPFFITFIGFFIFSPPASAQAQRPRQQPAPPGGGARPSAAARAGYCTPAPQTACPQCPTGCRPP